MPSFSPRERKGRCTAEFSDPAACAVDTGHPPAFQMHKSTPFDACRTYKFPRYFWWQPMVSKSTTASDFPQAAFVKASRIGHKVFGSGNLAFLANVERKWLLQQNSPWPSDRSTMIPHSTSLRMHLLLLNWHYPRHCHLGQRVSRQTVNRPPMHALQVRHIGARSRCAAHSLHQTKADEPETVPGFLRPARIRRAAGGDPRSCSERRF